jgi:DNA-binding GntR family transcriptional regulator
MPEKNLAENIASQLRRDILRGKLLPGASIKERDNAAEMGVSRTPLREATRILAQEGLVDLRPARSPIVAIPSVKQVSDDVEVLLALEVLAAELACERASVEDIATIATVQDEIEQRFGKIDPLDLFELDMSFHIAIARAAQNLPLAEIHRTFLMRLWRGRYLASIKRQNLERVVRHHTEIVNALRDRDPVAIRSTILHHLGHLRSNVVAEVHQQTEAYLKSKDASDGALID